MGTRGLVGIRFRGVYYYFYNHWDSYYSYLGKNLIKEIKEWLKIMSVEDFIKMFENAIDNYKLCTKKYLEENNLINNIDHITYDFILKKKYITPVELYDSAKQDTLFLEYIYTLDLDNKIFLSDSHLNEYEYTFEEIKTNNIFFGEENIE